MPELGNRLEGDPEEVGSLASDESCDPNDPLLDPQIFDTEFQQEPFAREVLKYKEHLFVNLEDRRDPSDIHRAFSTNTAESWANSDYLRRMNLNALNPDERPENCAVLFTPPRQDLS